jgi:hypothetical protein
MLKASSSTIQGISGVMNILVDLNDLFLQMMNIFKYIPSLRPDIFKTRAEHLFLIERMILLATSLVLLNSLFS